MIVPTHKNTKKDGVSIWHKNVGDLLTRGGAKIPNNELAVFCRQMAFLLNAGVKLKEMLPIISGQMKGRLITNALPLVHQRVLQGESFSASLEAVGCFPAFLCALVNIGEKTALLPKVCEQLADYYENQAQAQSELTAALVYPIAVTVMMLGVIIMAVAFVLPGYADVFAQTGVALPALTRGLLAVSAFLATHILLLVLAMIVFLGGLVVYARSTRGTYFFALVQLKMGVLRQRVNLKLVQSVALMLEAGQSVSAALPLCASVIDNMVVQQDLQAVHTDLATGRAFWVAIADLSYIDPLLVGLARVGEETGHLQQTMAQCEQYFTYNYRRSLQRINKLVEPIITLILGVLLAVVMLAIVLPTFEMATVM